MKKKYLTVTALTKYIKRKIDTDPHLSNVLLRGEISNFNHHSRGHMYFTLKDDQTTIRAVMFAGHNRRLRFTPENGMSVLVQGEVSVFKAFGQYQLYVHQMEPDGLGSLYLAFEQLKEKLEKRGMFDERHKKPIPTYPGTIGVVTSPTGAAIQDILSTLESRYPIASVIIFPALVQGEQAAKSIVKAIHTANSDQIRRPDTLIVGRGGGSIEDLWPFNEEIVANAIFNSKIPVITAVGHETDTTISDFVSDLRAPTPTGAATLAVPSYNELMDRIQQNKYSLRNYMDIKLKKNRQLLNRMNQSYAFRYPEHLIKQKEQELDQKTDMIERGLHRLVIEKEQSYEHVQKRLFNQFPIKRLNESQNLVQQVNSLLNRSMNQLFERKAHHMQATIEKLSLLSPLETMKRGFAIPYTKEGAILKSHKDVHANDVIKLEIVDGHLNCKVLNVRGNRDDKRE